MYDRAQHSLTQQRLRHAHRRHCWQRYLSRLIIATILVALTWFLLGTPETIGNERALPVLAVGVVIAYVWFDAVLDITNNH
jgi:hypothetical protein